MQLLTIVPSFPIGKIKITSLGFLFFFNKLVDVSSFRVCRFMLDTLK